MDYSNEPGRATEFVVNSVEPFNAETPPGLLAGDSFTPNRTFFVRNHGPVPVVDPWTYRVVIEGMVRRPLELTLKDIQSLFEKVSIVATIEVRSTGILMFRSWNFDQGKT